MAAESSSPKPIIQYSPEVRLNLYDPRPEDISQKAEIGNLEVKPKYLASLLELVSPDDRDQAEAFLNTHALDWRKRRPVYWHVDVRGNTGDWSAERDFDPEHRKQVQEKRATAGAQILTSLLMVREFFKRNWNLRMDASFVGGDTNRLMARFFRLLGAQVYKAKDPKSRVVLVPIRKILSRKAKDTILMEREKTHKRLREEFGKEFVANETDYSVLRINPPFYQAILSKIGFRNN